MRVLILPVLAPLLGLAACGPERDAALPGDAEDTRPYTGISRDETLHVTGTEPFWAGEVTGGTFLYKTPDDQDGATITVDRFAGRNGLSFSGTLNDQKLVMAVTPGQCSDGMSDRTYPFTVTLRLGDETRSGCGWTEVQPFAGPASP